MSGKKQGSPLSRIRRQVAAYEAGDPTSGVRPAVDAHQMARTQEFLDSKNGTQAARTQAFLNAKTDARVPDAAHRSVADLSKMATQAQLKPTPRGRDVSDMPDVEQTQDGPEFEK